MFQFFGLDGHSNGKFMKFVKAVTYVYLVTILNYQLCLKETYPEWTYHSLSISSLSIYVSLPVGSWFMILDTNSNSTYNFELKGWGT